MTNNSHTTAMQLTDDNITDVLRWLHNDGLADTLLAHFAALYKIHGGLYLTAQGHETEFVEPGQWIEKDANGMFRKRSALIKVADVENDTAYIDPKQAAFILFRQNKQNTKLFVTAGSSLTVQQPLTPPTGFIKFTDEDDDMVYVNPNKIDALITAGEGLIDIISAKNSTSTVKAGIDDIEFAKNFVRFKDPDDDLEVALKTSGIFAVITPLGHPELTSITYNDGTTLVVKGDIEQTKQKLGI